MGRKKPRAPSSAGNPSGGTLGDLFRAAGVEAPDLPPEDTPTDAQPAPTAWPGRVVVRRERKGHGGKTITRVERVPESLGREAQAKALRSALGTGARVHGEDLIVQGDVVDRVATWLRAQGVVEVVQGG